MLGLCPDRSPRSLLEVKAGPSFCETAGGGWLLEADHIIVLAHTELDPLGDKS